jgi:hypothetical protein
VGAADPAAAGADGALPVARWDDLVWYNYRRVPAITLARQLIDGHTTGWRKIHVTNFEHPYMDRWWVPGLTIGYEHTFVHAAADFLKGVATGTPAEPTFQTALQTQRVCDAILKSAKTRQWVETAVTGSSREDRLTSA